MTQDNTLITFSNITLSALVLRVADAAHNTADLREARKNATKAALKYLDDAHKVDGVNVTKPE